MPHAWIEYSKNIADEAEVGSLGKCVHDAMMETGIFPLAGIRVRINRIDDYLVADCKPENAFVHLAIRIGEGRDMETKTAAADLIFERLSAHLKPLADRTPLAVAFEMQEIRGPHSYKMNNLHRHLAGN
ncbi:5-carboxymethyl-2-hydroxymuconate Delta-isomerase [Stappia indica]|uniref:5-carboxymethyl-2-hydroxymuconate Delta-isomerase n=1 Tax=Stappia indica TaxID=538381 RepID=UPI001CD800C3|nr:5-carboxymethyl-2-hydroxymuconate Delta-isomerase [Stappia indica]MCA1298095.1 5-carboxymethyl-2-hydroxymuconate Delta-isomerase [Stappia indica]